MSNDLKAGGKLVQISGPNTDIIEIERIGANGWPYDNQWRRICMEHFRPATAQEIEANKRLGSNGD